MMAYFDCFLRLLLVFPVVGFANLYACQAAVADLFPQNAEQKLTHSPTRLFTKRQQHWESPSSTLSLNHHALNNAVGAAAASQSSFQTKNVQLASTQRQQRSISERVADSIAYSVSRFALRIGNQLSENAYYSKSEVYSPLSLMSALSLLLAGAKGNTYQQLQTLFNVDNDDGLQRDPNYAQYMHQTFGDMLQDIEQHDLKILHYYNHPLWRDTPAHYNIKITPQRPNEPLQHIIKVANGLFAQKGYTLNPSYRDVITAIYRSELAELDYRNNNEAARQHINTWVSQKTYGKIPYIIHNAIPQETNLILASVLYFKAFWENTFFEAATALDNFYPEGATKPPIRVQMMATGGLFPFYESLEHNCRIIGLPYKGNLTTMYVIQPKQSSRAVLRDLQNKLTSELIEDMISKMVYRTAIVAFPKMHIERQLNMKEIFRKFGITDMFSNAASDLSLIGGVVPQTVQHSIPIFNRERPHHVNTNEYDSRKQFKDRFNEAPLFFSTRFGETGNETMMNDAAMEVNSNVQTTTESVTEKSVDEKTTLKPEKEEKATDTDSRKKRQTAGISNPLSFLEAERLAMPYVKSDLYVEDILHKVDFEVNEQGTEAAAATLTYLRRSGTDVTFRAETPFILLIRHDPSKLILFYGIINEPES